MMERDDFHAILALLRTYAAHNDEGRWHEAAALFTEDARFTRPSDPHKPIVGREAILQSFLARPKGPRRHHLVANPVVERIDGDTARARCYSVLLTELGESQGNVTVGGFDDVLARTDAGWRFCSRTGFTLFDPLPFTAQHGAPWPLPAAAQSESS